MTTKVERLVNLTVALLEAPRPLTFAEIKQRTGYYTDGDAATTRRRFERDKADLRRLGVPIATATPPMSDEQGYTIARREYEQPDLQLTAEEVAALGLAVRLTGGSGTPLALAKLAARAPDPVELPDPATRVELPVDPIDAIAEAVVRRRTLRFTYRRADGSESARTVDPYAVVRRRAAWYVVGRDHDRDAQRAFRLDRMVDRPMAEEHDDAFTPPDDLDVAAAVAGPGDDGVAVRLAVAPGARWAVGLRGGRPTGELDTEGWEVFELTGLHPWRDRSWILGLGAEVEVLQPPALRAAVLEALDRLVGQPPAEPSPTSDAGGAT